MGAAESRAAPAPAPVHFARSPRHRNAAIVSKDWVWTPQNSQKDVWGPVYWRHLHLRAIAWGANPDVRQIAEEHNYLQSLFAGLPCPECRIHARKYYDSTPPSMCSSQTYQAWVHTFHNTVNQRLGKPQITWEEYQELYRHELLGRMA